jgi:hypothetical protein
MRMCSNRFVQIGMSGGRIRVLTTLRRGAAARLLGGDPGLSATRGHTLQTKPYRRGKQRQGEIILHFAQMHGKTGERFALINPLRDIRLGPRPVKSSVGARIGELRAKGMGMLKIGRTLGIGTSVVQRVVPSS